MNETREQKLKAIRELLRGGHVVLQTNSGALELQGSEAVKVGQILQDLWQMRATS